MKKPVKMTDREIDYARDNLPVDIMTLKRLRKDAPVKYAGFKADAKLGVKEEEEAERQAQDMQFIDDNIAAIAMLPHFAVDFTLDAQEEWANSIQVDVSDVIEYVALNKKKIKLMEKRKIMPIVNNIENLITIMGRRRTDKHDMSEIPVRLITNSTKYHKTINDAQETILLSSVAKDVERAKFILKKMGVAIKEDPFANVKKKAYVAGDQFHVGGMGEVVGRYGHLKTTWLLDVMFCVAHGLEWQGMPVMQGKVVYVAGEDMDGALVILEALSDKYGVELDRTMFHIIPEDEVALMDEANMLTFSNKLKSLGDVRMVCFDTLRKLAGKGFNITNGTGWGDVIENIGKYVKPFSTTTFWVTHPTKTGKIEMAGTDDRINDIEYVYLLVKKGAGVTENILSFLKNKGAPVHKPRSYKYEINEKMDIPLLINKNTELNAKNQEVKDLVDAGMDDKEAIDKVYNPDGTKTEGAMKQQLTRVRKALSEV